ncbi:YciI family protein [Nonomuraea sp. NPDC050556]|uniref:YciI family protein n=1 Tax=Nonomuraea sp. NPDC050556 TaxID=3364369 RepID=UPI00378D258D
MRYILMSNVEITAMEAMPAEAFEAAMARFVDFTRALTESGVLLAVEQLAMPDTATTVRNRDGRTLLTDGPFADVAERFGGFWIVEAPDLDTVLKYAADCPAADYGSVEVRPVLERG